jgi:hypothetical protein
MLHCTGRSVSIMTVLGHFHRDDVQTVRAGDAD